jgi:hypothetical protein
MHPDLQRALDQLNDVGAKYEHLIQSNTARINDRPKNGGWSIGECIDHVNTIARELVGPMKKTIDGAKSQGKLSAAPHKPGFLGKYMTRSMEPPVKKKMKTQKLYEPKSNFSAEQLLQDYRTSHDQLKQLVVEADGVNITKVKMASPAWKLLKINLGDWFLFTASHERRHLWQAEQVAKGLKS